VTDVRPDSTPSTASPTVKTFVLDTSVLLSDPGALGRFGEHQVVIPLVVIGELEGKRHHPELGWFARQTLRSLDELRIKHGRLDAAVPVGNDGGTMRVELNHSDLSTLPAGFRLESNDSRILAVALNLGQDGHDVTLVTKDMPLRVKAASVGLTADEYRVHPAVDSGWTGMKELEVGADVVDALYDDTLVDPVGRDELSNVAELPCHTGLVLHSPRGSALARVTADKQLRLVRGDREAFGRRARPVARPRGRHRVPRRPGGHRQVRARAVRRPRVGARAAGAQEGRCLPAAVRRRWPGARLPAR
jgi:PhoH-like ATPase